MSWMDFSIYHSLKQPGNVLPVEVASLKFVVVFFFLFILSSPDPTTWFWKINRLILYDRRPRLVDRKNVNMKEKWQWKTDISFLFSASRFTYLLVLICVIWCRQKSRSVNVIELHLYKRIIKDHKLWQRTKKKKVKKK